MSHVKEKHMARRGLEPMTYHRLGEYSDLLAIGPYGKSVISTICTAA